jgi:hypothetical protein
LAVFAYGHARLRQLGSNEKAARLRRLLSELSPSDVFTNGDDGLIHNGSNVRDASSEPMIIGEIVQLRPDRRPKGAHPNEVRVRKHDEIDRQRRLTSAHQVANAFVETTGFTE